MNTDANPSPAVSSGAVEHLAEDLVADLSDHVADPEGVAVVMGDYRRDLGGDLLGQVAIAALHSTFGEYMSLVDPVDMPPSAIQYSAERNPS